MWNELEVYITGNTKSILKSALVLYVFSGDAVDRSR
jgi:hypothetical protein